MSKVDQCEDSATLFRHFGWPLRSLFPAMGSTERPAASIRQWPYWRADTRISGDRDEEDDSPKLISQLRTRTLTASSKLAGCISMPFEATCLCLRLALTHQLDPTTTSNFRDWGLTFSSCSVLDSISTPPEQV